MKLKEVDRTGNVAWSPAAHHPIQLAVGTAAQQLDATFSTMATLEIYSLNLGDPSQEMELTGSLTTDSRFFRLVWSPSGQLLGGAEQGQIFIWDPEKIQKKDSNSLIHQLKKHTGPVAALDINPFQTNLIASGAGDSEIFIWDLANVEKPMTPGAKAQPLHDVSSVAWNKQVQHILGSCHGGSCVVWDLRKNEPIIKIRDSMSRIKANSLCWHPDVATQLCIASEDDHTPVIQLWDLRAASSPLHTLEYHQRGILSMAWCPNDADLLLSCGKDNRILCWNPNSDQPAGEVVYELCTDSGQWSFDVQWCPRNPAVISSCSFDGHISVYSLMGGGHTTQTSSKVTDAFDVGGMGQPALPQHRPTFPSGGESSTLVQEPMLGKAPKWLRRPVGATFGFGGKLVCFENPKSPAAAAGMGSHSGPQMAPAVTVSRVVTAGELVNRSVALEGALQQGAYSEFCDRKIGAGGEGAGGGVMDRDIDLNVWEFLKVNFEENPRLRYLELLGYDNTRTGQQVIDRLEAESTKKSNQSEAKKRATPQPVPGEDDETDLTNGMATLDAFGKSDSSSAFDSITAVSKEQELTEFDDSPLMISINDDYEGLVTKALLTANFEAAVEAALHFDHLAEAVILASAGGPELLEKTQRRVLCTGQGQHSALNKLISAVVTRDLESIVRTSEIKNWRESLTTILTYADGEEFTSLCNMLGSRLESEDKPLSVYAQLCYIVAGSLDQLITVWCNTLPPNTSQHALQNLIEKVMILRKAVEMYQGPSELNNEEINGKLTEYAQLLAAQGCAPTAYSYLLNSNNNHLPIALLKDRLYHSLHPSAFTQAASAPPKPFNVIDIKPDQQQQQQQWQPQQPQQQQPQQQQTRTQQLQQSQQQRRMSGQQQQSRQRTDSGNYSQGGHISHQQQSHLAQSSQPHPYQAPVSHSTGGGAYPGQAGPISTYQPVQPSLYPDPHHAPPAPVGGASSRGPMGKYHQPSHAQVQPPQPPIQTYDPTSYQPVLPPTSAGGGYSSNSMTGAQYIPGGPAIPAAHLPRASTAWNDPPSVSSDTRKTGRTAGGDHAPGAPSTWEGIQLYNPQEHQQQHQPPHHHGQPTNQQQQQHWGAPQNPQPMPTVGMGSSGMGMSGQQQQHHQPQRPAVVEEVKKVVQPIPAEHIILQQVLDKLTHLCISTTTNQQVKKKLEDVLKKLELLYDRLRGCSLSAPTLSSLHQIVQCVQQYDYPSSLSCHADLVRVGSFSEISAFMPAVKTLLQTAQQLQAYIQ